MTISFNAIYANGILQPDCSLPFTDQTKLSLQAEPLSDKQENEMTAGRSSSRSLLDCWDRLEEIICQRWTTISMRQLFSTLRKVANTDVPVLILGEPGTEKTEAAAALHRLSGRRGVCASVICGLTDESELHVQLFGCGKGYLPRSRDERQGEVDRAREGTLVLDGIDMLPPNLQPKLLTLIRDHTFARFGAMRTIAASTRIVALATADLSDLAKSGKFLLDLYYQLTVVVLTIPPLRHRRADIPLLAEALLEKFNNAKRNGPSRLSRDALVVLHQHDWPGNVHELENRIREAALLCEGSQILPGDLQLNSPASPILTLKLKERREVLERDLIRTALGLHNGKIASAAAELGISRPTMYELMGKLGIR